MQNENKISYVKGTYIWSFNKSYESKIKMIKSIDGNIKLQNTTIFKDDLEYILKPRCIINDPFDEENSILLSCDIINLENQCNNFDGRMSFLKHIQYFGNAIKDNDSKISFTQKFKIFEIKDIDLKNLSNILIKYCISCNIEIDEIDIYDDIIEISNKTTNVLSACDELYFLRYIFNELSLKEKFKYEFYDNLAYKFTDEKTLGTDGIEFINNYVKKLKLKHSLIKQEELHEKYKEFEIEEVPNKKAIFIPKSTKLTKNGYFIDNRFVADTDPYTVIFSNINEIYS